MAVTKCKECKSFKIDQQRAHKEHPSVFSCGYYCHYHARGKALTALEVKTSPKWCPLRKEAANEASD